MSGCSPILGKRQPQPHGRHDHEGAHEACPSDSSLDPVLLIPGIGGSILNAVSSTGSKERIWVRLVLADLEFRNKLWSRYNPDTGRSESLAPDSHIEVPEDNHGLYSCDLLDPDLAVPVEAVCYYHSMIGELRSWGYKDGQDLFGFGYDFRQSNRLPETMERLRRKLQSIHDKTGRKVDVVTHSMGGLLFKSFVALHSEDVAKYVSKWVAIAAPFRGAPGFITDTLLTGVEFLRGWQSSLFVAKWSMHQLLVECPSVYELMADYEFPWEDRPELRVVRAREAEVGEDAGAVEGAREEAFGDKNSVLSVMEKVLSTNTVTLNGSTIPLPLNKRIVALAEETRAIWASATLPECVEFFSIYGVSLDTPFHSRYGSKEQPVKDWSDILHMEVEFECRDGDGTVPVESAQGDGFEAMYRVGVPGEHRALLNDNRVHRILNFFLKVPPFDSLYDPYTDCILLPPRAEIEAEMEAKRFRTKGQALATMDASTSANPRVSTCASASASVYGGSSISAKGVVASGLALRASSGSMPREQALPQCSDVEGDEDVVEITLSTMPEQPLKGGP